MKRMVPIAAMAVAMPLFGADTAGIRPRPAAGDYPAQQANAGFTVGAESLSPDEVSNTFATDLNKGWIVVEVAVYPKKEATRIEAEDFVLRVGAGDEQKMIRPTDGKAIAGILHRKTTKAAANSDADVTVYPTVGIGYESGPSYNDPVTGTRRGGGVRTSVGVGVGIGGAGSQPPPPASTGADRTTMETELLEKALPEGAVLKPIAGYLYFPRPARMKSGDNFELQYIGDEGTVKLPLPQPRRAKK
jgi:hypothetical protein